MPSTFLDHLDVRAMDDGKNWIVLHEFRYVTRDGEVITVPAGFVTDFASIPWFFRRVAQPATGKHRRAAVIHDWIYRTASVQISREKADLLFQEIMDIDGTPIWKSTMLYQAVDKFGRSSYVTREASTTGS